MDLRTPIGALAETNEEEEELNRKVGLSFLLSALVLGAVFAAPSPVFADVKVRVYVPAPPPPPVPEVVAVSPGPDYVWIGGYHRWDGHAYVWAPGHYTVRPNHQKHWVSGHWSHSHKGHYWVDGHWK